jgi:hypothetical protein
MWRYLVGMLAGVLLMGGGLLWWHSRAIASHVLPEAPVALAGLAAGGNNEEVPEPPIASEKTREQKRFSRYDHDKNGAVSREEFLAARRKAFAKLDTDHDGKLSFDEYAVKTETRFADADADHNGTLTPAEFATTRIARKPRAAAPRCPPETAGRREEAEEN